MFNVNPIGFRYIDYTVYILSRLDLLCERACEVIIYFMKGIILFMRIYTVIDIKKDFFSFEIFFFYI